MGTIAADGWVGILGEEEAEEAMEGEGEAAEAVISP